MKRGLLLVLMLILAGCPKRRGDPTVAPTANYTEEPPFADYWFTGLPPLFLVPVEVRYGAPFIEPLLEDTPPTHAGSNWLPPPVSGPPLRYPSFMLPPPGGVGVQP